MVRRLSESPVSGWRGDVTGQIPESTLDGFSVSTDQPPPCGDSEAHPRCFSEFRDAGSRSSEKIRTQPNLVSILSSVTYSERVTVALSLPSSKMETILVLASPLFEELNDIMHIKCSV